MSSSILASTNLDLRYGFCTNSDVSILLPLSFELLLPKTIIGSIYVYEVDSSRCSLQKYIFKIVS